MSATVTAWPGSDVHRLTPLFDAPSLSFFERAYRVPAASLRSYLLKLFTRLAGESPRKSALLVAETAGAPAGLMLLARAEWESGIYGVEMARAPWVVIGESAEPARQTTDALLRAAEPVFARWNVRHASALVPAGVTGAVQSFEAAGWRLVDSTIELAWEAGRTSAAGARPELTVRAARESDRAPLRELTRDVYTSSIRTRFLADPWLPAEKTGELYARWFENALDGTFGDHVGVVEIDGRPVGFNTLKREPELSNALGIGFAAHGIAAVDRSARGFGAQPALLHDAMEWFGAEAGRFTRGRVLINNQPMQRACLKSGGFITSGYHSFHVWLQNGRPAPDSGP